MRLGTTLENLDEFIDKYEDLLSCSDCIEVQEDKTTKVGIYNYRIQIPEYKIALRNGYLMSGPEDDSSDEDEHDGFYSYAANIRAASELGDAADLARTLGYKKEEPEWEVESSVALVCDINETDSGKYLFWSTGGFQDTVFDYIRNDLHIKLPYFFHTDDIRCIIDTSDFIPDEDKAVALAKRCDENYEDDLAHETEKLYTIDGEIDDNIYDDTEDEDYEEDEDFEQICLF